MVTRVLAALLVLLAACKFDERNFGDRGCAADQDCPRPDQACLENICTQKACTGTDTRACGTEYNYTCEVGGCVATECTQTTDCPLGFACTEGFCQASFNVASVVATSNTSIAVTFDSPPEAASAVVLANYAVDGLTLAGTPSLNGATVALTTSPQQMTAYNVTVANVVRDMDGAPLIEKTGTFTGRKQFVVASAMAQTAISVLVTFSEAPDPATAMNTTNYTIPGLTIIGTPVIAGNTVRLTTSGQAPTSYTLTVSNVRRADDAEALSAGTAVFTGRNDFNVDTATSLTSTSISVTFDAVPNTVAATTLANYSVVPSLTLSGTPALNGNTVTITTSAQTTALYTVSVANVTRGGDGEPLMIDAAAFMGRSPFNVSSASPITSTSVLVTFDATPDPTQAGMLANYSIPGLTLTGVNVSGNLVTLTTSPQTSSNYMLTVSNVARTDGESLATNTATFAGRTPFNVTSAQSTSNTTVAVVFDALPNAGQANSAANYTIPGLTVVGAVLGGGNTVTLTTTSQAAQGYTVTVANVTRGDGEALTTTMANFAGRSQFNVMTAAAPTSSTITVKFTAPPNVAQATTLGNYAIDPPITLSGVPMLVNDTVTITTGVQLAQQYTVTVSNVRRASDAEPLTVNATTFMGRSKFNVASAASASNVTMRVTFDAAPDPTQATTLANYDVQGLVLSGTPVLNGNTVTINTSSQSSAQSYTVTVSNVTRATDMEPLLDDTASFTGLAGFNVAGAVSNNTSSISVTFDAPPNPTQATTLSNYAVAGLTLSGTPALNGSTVTIATSNQATTTYTVTVSGVTRASDASPLVTNAAQFSHVTFNVASAQSLTNRTISVTFDAAPSAATATMLANYSVAGLTLMGTPVLAGNTVTIQTASQTGGTNYTVTANNVTRDSDGSILTNKSAQFVGRAAFNVTGSSAPTSGTMTVTFSHAPNVTQATTRANYSVSGGLALTGTPILVGNTVTINTGIQNAMDYTVTVANVTRATDAEPLGTNMSTFTGKALTTPTVTNVAVQATVPNNSTTFFNTGTATVLITGTDFANVDCMPPGLGVALDDLNGAGMAVSTQATSCTVNSNTSITAVFPAGIRTNGTTGWNVRVTNSVGTNTTSAQKLVVEAGLVVSEVYVSSGGPGGSGHEFLEIYNPTANDIDVNTLGLKVHVRDDGGTNTLLNLSFLPGNANKLIKSHGYLLITSTQSSTDSWFANRNATYDVNQGELEANGSVYLSLSTTPQLLVLDKAGWGSQPAAGVEGAAIANIANFNSSQRRPAGGLGATQDNDANNLDFLPPSTSTTPKGTSATPEP